MADRYLLESGAPDGYLLESGSGVLLLDHAAPFAATPRSRFVAEEETPWSPRLRLRFLGTPGLTAAYTLAAGSGTYGVTGLATRLLVAWHVPAASGTYAATGMPSLLRVARSVALTAGAYAIAGAAAALTYAAGATVPFVVFTPRTRIAGAFEEGDVRPPARVRFLGFPSLPVPVFPAALLTRRTAPFIEPGEPFTWASVQRIFLRLPDQYPTIFLVPARRPWRRDEDPVRARPPRVPIAVLFPAIGHYALVAAAGVYTIVGGALRTLTAWHALESPGAYGLTGRATQLPTGRKMSGAPGTYLVSGAASLFRRTAAISAAAGAYALTGASAGTRLARRMLLGAGAYVVSGMDAALLTFHAGAAELAFWVRFLRVVLDTASIETRTMPDLRTTRTIPLSTPNE